MIKLYFHPSPNPLKIALYLEETGTPYELIPVDTRKGEQHADAFKAIVGASTGGNYAGTAVALNTIPVIGNQYPFAGASTPIDPTAAGNFTSNFRTDHPGGCNFVYADGHVGTVNDGIDLAVYQGLSTKAGGVTGSAE